MDGVLVFFGAMIGLGLTALVIVLPIVALVRANRAARLATQNQDSWQKLTQRVHALETQLQEVQLRSTQQAFAQDMTLQQLKDLTTKLDTVAPGATPVPPPAAATDGEAPTAEPPRPAVVVIPSQPAITAPLIPARTAKTTASPHPPSPVDKPPTAKPLAPPIPPPTMGVLGAAKSVPQEAAKRIFNLEEILGTNWFSKLGVIGIVIGVALLMAREMTELGPAGRVVGGIALGAALLGAGVFFERRERWRILARAGMGGGWALLYFTTYAMDHIDAARILDSEALDFFLLLIVAAAMVAHTLRYHSRVITGIAFLLAFSTINISRAGPTSLLASAILAAALVVIVLKREWYDLEVLAIVAIFLNHYYWLRPIIEPMHRHRHPFPEFLPSAALLIFYWAIFRASYILRRNLNEADEKISTVGALLNSFLFLGVMKYQAVHPQWAFYALLVIGTIEFTLGQLPITRRRRTAFIILSTIGATLVAVAFPFKFSGLRLPVLWLGEAEALVLAGIFTREILFRWLGITAELLVAGHMFIYDTGYLGALRDAKATDFSDPRRATAFGLAALIIFANVHWIPRHWRNLLKAGFEAKFYRLQSYLAGLLLVAAVWAVCSEPWLAVALAACALILAVVGARWKIDELSVLANSFALLAFLRIVLANFAVVEVSYFNVKAVISILLAASFLYAASRWIAFPSLARTYKIPEAYTWVATFVLALLAWYQLWPASVALGWALIGLVLFQLGYVQRSASYRLQSYLLFMASFFRVFFVNFNAEQSPGLLSPRLYTALPLAFLFYFVYGRLERNPEAFLATDTRLKAAQLHCLMGTIVVAAAMRFELSPDWIAAAWSGLVCLFVLTAWRYGRRIFLGQALLLAAAVFFRTLLHNFYQRSYFPPPTFLLGGWMTTGTVILLLFVALLIARRLKLARPEGAAKEGLIRRAFAAIYRDPMHVFFFAAFILLTGLLFVELRSRGMATVAWGAEAVAVFLFALALKERTFRLSAITLLIVCVGKVILIDVWGLKPLDRDLTIIITGVALVSVSILFTRYKEVLRAYL